MHGERPILTIHSVVKVEVEEKRIEIPISQDRTARLRFRGAGDTKQGPKLHCGKLERNFDGWITVVLA